MPCSGCEKRKAWLIKQYLRLRKLVQQEGQGK